MCSEAITSPHAIVVTLGGGDRCGTGVFLQLEPECQSTSHPSPVAEGWRAGEEREGGKGRSGPPPHFLAINAVVGQITGQAETCCFYPDNASVTHLSRAGGELALLSLGRQMQTVVN